ncbi:hypothetical protein CCACVL1_16810 [Corchorus capsularis]|uniref:Protein kinase domain-containing protein n=1 Tax=Corchorus capsularis TaxID=210143 RepID=A0A1R3HVC6_COCAP|nr:hypothetical protein CCACVL1_16810 [Corchorus capsularis]
MKPADYRFLEVIGDGATATVYKAMHIPTGNVVAVKVLDLDRCNNGNLDNIRRETQTMNLIQHANIIRSHCSFVVGRNLWVVMEFMSEGSCYQRMKIGYPDGIEESAIKSILKETLKALNYLHKQGHIHRDVKAGNILLDKNGAVKLADFGVSACMFDSGDRQRCRNTFVGTPCWMAPEVMQEPGGSGYDYKADIWSFGITALELAHGHAPFSDYPPMKQKMKVEQVLRMNGGVGNDSYAKNSSYQGLIEEGKLESFDLPYYAATKEEVKKVIEAEGSFTIQRLEAFGMDWDDYIKKADSKLDKTERAAIIARDMRAVGEPILGSHFGEEIMDDLFRRFEEDVLHYMEEHHCQHINMVMSLIKKDY